MPELPEVETIRLGLLPVMEGARIAAVEIRRSDLRFPVPGGFASLFRDALVQTIGRRGKYLLFFCDNGCGFSLHLGMSGRVQIIAPDEDYSLQKHDHLVFTLNTGARIVFNDARRFGYVFLLEGGCWEDQMPFAKMGPEPLGNNFNGPVLARRLKGKTCSIKTALLDQRVVSGVGNIYACEALYGARIHPECAAGDVQGQKAEALAGAIKHVLQSAIAAGGSSLRDYKKTDGALGYFQHGFSVYDREGVPCPDCTCDTLKTGGVSRLVQAGRSTFYCSRKQK